LPFCHAHLTGPRPLPRSYPQVLATIGDHLRKRRLDLGLRQRDVADQLGVDETTVANWELNRTEPALRFLPGIVGFLGYAPWAAGGSIGKRLLASRRERGLSQPAFARLLGIDPGTLSRWERNLRVPTGGYARLAEAFLARCAPDRAREPKPYP
jgi:transcriptional regulator with XRE-family HTH domain